MDRDLEHPLHVAGAATGAPVQPTLKITDDLLASFGEAFHAALHKGVDGPHSFIAWNAIVMMPDNVYRAFCDYMIETLKKECHLRHEHWEITFSQFAALLRGWSSEPYRTNLYTTDHAAWYRLSRGEDGHRLKLVHIFDAAIVILPDADIANIMWFMGQE